MTTKVIRYRLVPILVKMDACEKSIEWLEKEGFDTFAEAWGEARASWQSWLCYCPCGVGLIDPKVRETEDDVYRALGGSYTRSYKQRLADAGITAERMEKALLKWAKLNDCLVVDDRPRSKLKRKR